MSKCLLNYLVNGIIPEENEEGNIEYKRRLDYKTQHQLKKSLSQMIWRINEGYYLYGKHEAIYYLGINDDGKPAGLTKDILNKSIEIIKELANKADSNCLINKYIFNGSHIAEVIINKKNDGISKIEKKICLIGHEGSGKTTWLGNMLYDMRDDGNGLSRSMILNHYYEIESGHSISLSKNEIIGIKNKKIINYRTNNFSKVEDIYINSDEIINIYDTPGLSKYYKITLYTISSVKPDSCLIFCNPNQLTPANIHKRLLVFINLCRDLEIDYKIVFTHCESYIDFEWINKYLDGYVNISNKRDNKELFMFYLLGIKINRNQNNKNNIFHINHIYSLGSIDNNYKIIAGSQINGNIIKGRNYYLFNGNDYVNIIVKNIHRKRIEFDEIKSGEVGSLEIDLNIDQINNKMIVVSNKLNLIDQASFITSYPIVFNKIYKLFYNNQVVNVYFKNNKIKFINKKLLLYSNCNKAICKDDEFFVINLMPQ